MKKLLFTVAATACLVSAFALAGCDGGEATVTYALSEDGTYYIVSGVQGNTRKLTEYEVPATYSAEEGGEELPVKEIGEKAFLRCEQLRSVILPEGLEVIGVNAFTFCGLTQIDIPETVTTIGFAAFGGCEYLKEVTVPQSVTSLDVRAFAYCSGLEKAVIKAEVTELKFEVFKNTVQTSGGNIYTDTHLTEVYFGSSVTKVNKYAFYGNFLTDVYFAGSEEEWKAINCYETVEKEDAEGETEEKSVSKEDTFGSATIHFNSQF